MEEQPGPGSGVQFVEVDETGDGQRIDNYLFRVLKGVPKSHVYRMLRRGEVRVNKGRSRADRKLKPGDVIRIPPVRTGRREDETRPSSRLVDIIEKSIIYEDDRILVINKPTGVAVHGGSGVSAGVIEALRMARPDDKSLELVHRLDRDTSGCLMVARRRSALRTLQAALREKSGIGKHYEAIVHGRWPRHRNSVEASLAKNTLASGERITRISAEGKASLTRFTVLGSNDALSVIEAEPVTGRTHQIRVHCMAAGFPVVGDPKYGMAEKDKAVRSEGYARMMLHARRLVVPPLAPGESSIELVARGDDEFERLKSSVLKKI